MGFFAGIKLEKRRDRFSANLYGGDDLSKLAFPRPREGESPSGDRN